MNDPLPFVGSFNVVQHIGC